MATADIFDSETRRGRLPFRASGQPPKLKTFRMGNRLCYIRGTLSLDQVLSKGAQLSVHQRSRLHAFDSKVLLEAYKQKLEAHYGRIVWPLPDRENGPGTAPLHGAIALAWEGDIDKTEEVARRMRRQAKKMTIRAGWSETRIFFESAVQCYQSAICFVSFECAINMVYGARYGKAGRLQPLVLGANVDGRPCLLLKELCFQPRTYRHFHIEGDSDDSDFGDTYDTHDPRETILKEAEVVYFQPSRRHSLVFGQTSIDASTAVGLYAVRNSEVAKMLENSWRLGFNDWHLSEIAEHAADRRRQGYDGRVEPCDSKKKRDYRRKEQKKQLSAEQQAIRQFFSPIKKSKC